MGTRADFYIGRGKDARWLGSCAYDGYPGSGLRKVITAQTQEGFELAVAARIAARDDGTKPEDGWPWPWKDSRTTDYAYAWDEGCVYIAYFGYKWRTLAEQEAHDGSGEDEDEDGTKACVFPDMTAVQKVTYGPRSGVLVLTFPRESGE